MSRFSSTIEKHFFLCSGLIFRIIINLIFVVGETGKKYSKTKSWKSSKFEKGQKSDNNQQQSKGEPSETSSGQEKKVYSTREFRRTGENVRSGSSQAWLYFDKF